MRVAAWLLMTMMLVAATCGAAQHGGGSCLRAGLCCPGRDSACVVQEAVPDPRAQGVPWDKPCYCDYACMQVGDCCRDFKQACEVIDCEVSAWGAWSDCSAACGSGTMVRERLTVRSPRNGGSPCPEQVQTRGCYGNRCDAKSVAKTHREMALLLPGKFSQARVINASLDIRRNLRLKNPNKQKAQEYVVSFEVSKVRKACESVSAEEGGALLAKGARLCVGCEAAAMRAHLGLRCNGHGVRGAPTRWSLVANPRCHGRWTRVRATDRCEDGKPDFVFV